MMMMMMMMTTYMSWTYTISSIQYVIIIIIIIIIMVTVRMMAIRSIMIMTMPMTMTLLCNWLSPMLCPFNYSTLYLFCSFPNAFDGVTCNMHSFISQLTVTEQSSIYEYGLNVLKFIIMYSYKLKKNPEQKSLTTSFSLRCFSSQSRMSNNMCLPICYLVC